MPPSQIQDFLPVLEGWFGSEIARLYNEWADPAPGQLLLGCPVWGQKYVDRFAHYCLPTLMSPRNAAALKGRTRLLIYTDTESLSQVWAYTRGLEAHGIRVRLVLISPEVMRHVPKAGEKLQDGDQRGLYKYWVLGVIGNALAQVAWRDQMGMHVLHPDHLYAPTYFENLFRLSEKYDGICQTGISANIVTAASEIERYRVMEEGPHKGVLIIPDRDLGDIGFRHLHKQTRGSLMNNARIPNDMPHSHFLAWQGRDKLVLHCCHMNAAWMRFDHDKPPRTRIPATLDAELPAFMQPDFYVPTIDDGMTFIEVSDDDKLAEEELVDLPTFVRRCWSHVRFQRDWMPWFVRPCEVPIHPQNTYLEDEDIQRQFAQILHYLDAGKFDAMEKFIGSLVDAR